MSLHIASDFAAAGSTRPHHAQRTVIRTVIICSALALALGGCYKRSVLQQSEGHITTPAAAPAVADVPAPARTSNFVPAPKPAVKAPTYTVVVSEVPVKELLFALARDTKQNIDIHPGLQGLVSLNAINETLPGILDRISKQVNMRFKIDGQTIIVSPDTPYMKTYKVNYVNMTRETTSEIGVTGQIQGGANSSGAGGSAGGGTNKNASSTVVKTVSNNNFWDTLRDNIRAILTSTRNQNMTAEQRAERAEAVRAQREERLQQAEAVARAGQGAPQLFNSVFGAQTGAAAAPTANDILNKIKDEEIEWIDLRFTDPKGRQHHITMPARDADDDVGRGEAAGINVAVRGNPLDADLDWKATSCPSCGGAAVRDMDHRAMLPKIRVPTLVIAGKHDGATPVVSLQSLP